MKVFLDTSFFVDFFRGKREAKEVYERVVRLFRQNN